MALEFENYYHSARTAWNWKKFFWVIFNIIALIIFGITLFKPEKLAFVIDDQVLLTELTTLITCVTSLISVGWFFKDARTLALTTALNLIVLIIFSLAFINPSLLAFLPLGQESLILTSLITACVASLITIITFAFENKNSADGWKTFCRFNQKKAILLTLLTFIVGITLLCRSAYFIAEIVANTNSILAWALSCGTFLSGSFLVFFVGRHETTAAFASYKNDPVIHIAQTANSVFDNAERIIKAAETKGITAERTPNNSENPHPLGIFYINRLASLVQHYANMASSLVGTVSSITDGEGSYIDQLRSQKDPKPSISTLISQLIDFATEAQTSMLQIEKQIMGETYTNINSEVTRLIKEMGANLDASRGPSMLSTSAPSNSMHLTAQS